MPQVPYTGVPGVEPDTTQPVSDRLNVGMPNLNLTGPATERLGAAVEQGGNVLAQHAIALQGIQNETMTRDALNGALNQMTDAEREYRSLRGQAAVAGNADYNAKINDIFKNAMASLPNQEARNLFAQAGFYSMRSALQSGALHAGEQQDIWEQTSLKANNEVLTSAAASRGGVDPHFLLTSAQAVQDNAAQLSIKQGGDATAQQAARLSAAGSYWRTILPGIMQDNPGLARQLFSQVHGSMDGPSQDAIERALKGTTERNEVSGFALTRMNSLTPQGVNDAARTSTFFDRLLYQEGGVNAAGVSLVSTAGAIGPGQILPSTARELAARHGVSLPATDQALRNTLAGDQHLNEMLSRLYVGDLLNKYGGNYTLTAAAYNAGEGRVDQWIKEYGDPRSGQISDLAWAKQIPIQETRQYALNVAQPSGVPQVAAGGGGYAQEARVIAQAAKDAAAKWPDRPDLQLQAIRTLHEQLSMQSALQEKDEADQQRAQRQAQEMATNHYMQTIYTDPSKLSIPEVLNDPNLTAERKSQLINIARSAVTRFSDHDTNTYGPDYYKVFSAIHAAEGDPNRITSDDQLYGMVGKGLTVAGFRQAKQELDDRRTPEGAANGALEKRLFDVARQQIVTPSIMSGGMPDTRGEEAYMRWMAQAYQAIDAGKKAGKSPYQLFDPSSPDYVGKSIGAFVRTPQQRMADIAGAAGIGAQPQPIAPKAAAGKFNLETQGGIVGAYKSGLLDYATAKRMLRDHGFIAGDAPDVVPH